MRFASTVIATVAFVNGSVEGSLANSKASSENTNFHDTIATNNDRNSNVHGRIQRRTNMNMAMMRNSVGNRKVRRRISAGGASGVGSNIDTARVPDYMVSEDTNEQSPAVPEQDIIDGTWLLYSLQFEESVHTVGGSDYQGQVNGLFCKIDLSAQKEDPSKAPFFTNFVRGAKCGQAGNHVSLNLHDIVQKTRAFDLDHTGDHSNPIKSIEPTAFLYHEGRCGSTLVSNSVTALAPERTRTYSEPMPALQALLDCDKTRVNCNVEKAANVFRDVVYMMGRTSNPVEDRMFFKLLPASILGVSIVKKAFPDVPWAFIYRDPVHVMVSNLRQKGSDKAPGPYCTGLKKHKHQSEYIQDLVISSSGKTVEELTREEYCAAYLATLTGAAAEELAFTEGGMGVNYEDMPGVLLDTLLPEHFGLPVGEKETERVLAQFGVYSKRMKRINPKEAKDDSAEKEEEASAEVRDAVNLFLSKSYGTLQILKEGQDVPSFQRKLTGWNESQTAEKSSAIIVYDPSLASKQQRRLSISCSDVFSGAQICCPQGGTEVVSNAVTTGAGTFCDINYPPCAFAAIGDCPFQTNTADTACVGLVTYTPYQITTFEDGAEQSCPAPTSSPTSLPTSSPTSAPTSLPTSSPTSTPTSLPTSSPTSTPTSLPTSAPTNAPTSQPTSGPTSAPTSLPTIAPSFAPTSQPASGTTSAPTTCPESSTMEELLDAVNDAIKDLEKIKESIEALSKKNTPSACCPERSKGKGKGMMMRGKGMMR